MGLFRLVVFLIVASNLCAQTPIFPLRDVRAGQRGIGKTVFSGNKIEEFQVEVLGVLENIGPKQSVILVRLSGGPLEKTGVIQGMSGSPVYINGRLLGAVALGFSFSKEPIAGIRPIEEMLAVGGAATPAPSRAAVPRRDVPLGGGIESMATSLMEIATPVSFSGFTSSALERFAPELKKLGLEPRQGVSSGGRLPSKLGNAGALRAGDMIAVELLSGDLSIGAEGTVTEVAGNRIYAFGHRFLSVGNTELPFARAEVLALLPNLSSSFKISSPLQWMGTITQDRSTALYGELGRKAATVPIAITVKDGHRAPLSYRMQMVNDRVLSPFIVQMAVFSALDATERTLGLASYTVRGAIEFQNGFPPLKLDNTYAGDFNVPLQASSGVASPLAYIMGAGFDSLKMKNITLTMEASERKRLLQIDQITASRKEARPGEPLDLTVTFTGENGVEVEKTVRYVLPIGAPAGTWNFTVTDGSYSNTLDYQQLAATVQKSPTQLLSFLNNLRPNTNAYLRVWRTDPAYLVQGQDLPDPPPSLGLILAKAQTAQGALFGRTSKIDELQIETGDMVVSGSKTVPVEVKE
ncbi:MAG TPA: SpoIVB peptidase S55 domain-containing protein [Bryobacteraceae bacterium]|nr:SpoIVB peptidase S55 domain-containing protein [Bryobacteraceae bacterium]